MILSATLIPMHIDQNPWPIGVVRGTRYARARSRRLSGFPNGLISDSELRFMGIDDGVRRSD